MTRRHEKLAPLSREHHAALVEGRRLRDLGPDADLPGGEGVERRRDAAAAFLAFWRADGAAHFRSEEEVLLPVFSRHRDPDRPEVVRMLLDHAEIRGMAMALSEALAGGGAPGADELRELGRRLMAHVRLEEDEVFPMIERELPDDVLRALPDFAEREEAQ